MPNWCRNDLEVTGPDEDIARLVERTTTDGQALSFALIVPDPDERDLDGTGLDVMDWRVFHGWGTKWDLRPDDCSTIREPQYVRWGFDTAWSPPLLWLEKVAAQFPTLVFRIGYDEPGMEFCGVNRYAHGSLTDQGTWRSGQSLSLLLCSAPGCDNFAEDAEPIDILDFDDEPDTDIFVGYCDDHALVRAVYDQQQADRKREQHADHTSEPAPGT